MRDLMQVGIDLRESPSEPGATQLQRMSELRSDADRVAQAFVLYLAHYPPKTRRTRHGVLGPVADVVKLAGKPLMTAGQATGRAVRTHEMAQQGRRLGSKAIDQIEKATEQFFNLVDQCPAHLRKSLRDRVLDHVYFLLRKEHAQFWSDFGEWLESEYKDLGVLNEAWKASFTGWAKVRLNRSDASMKDFERFKDWRKTKAQTIVEPDDEIDVD